MSYIPSFLKESYTKIFYVGIAIVALIAFLYEVMRYIDKSDKKEETTKKSNIIDAIGGIVSLVIFVLSISVVWYA